MAQPRGLASGIQRGLESGQQFIANEQQQMMRDRQLAELDRQEQKRQAMSAIDMGDRTKALEGMQRVAQQFGSPEEYLRYNDMVRADAETAKKQKALSFASALESGDFETANALAPEFGVRGKIAGFNPKTNSYRMHVADPRTPGKYTEADVSYDKIQRGLWMSLGGVDALKGVQELNFRREQLGLEREKLAAMRRGGGSGEGGDYKQEMYTEKGFPIYRKGDQGYVMHQGKLVPFDQQAEAIYGKVTYPKAGKGAAETDPVEAALIKSIESDPTRRADLDTYRTEMAQKRELASLAEEFRTEAQWGGYDIAVNNMVRRVSSEVRDPAKQAFIFQSLGIPDAAVKSSQTKLRALTR